MNSSARQFASVDVVSEIRVRGPWTTKSGGSLQVPLALSQTELFASYFSYDYAELARVPLDIRGLRIYTVRDIPVGRVGGTEFHRVRDEIVIGLDGEVEWECEDVYGARRVFLLTSSSGVRMPPFILHTYRSLVEKSGLLVIANTLFSPEDSRTHDTFSLDEFRVLQAEYSEK